MFKKTIAWMLMMFLLFYAGFTTSSSAANLEIDSGTVNLTDNPTVGQKNALKEARTYLKYMSFSRAGLIEQLTSPYGGGYLPEEAEYAILYLEVNGEVNWYEQAEKSAESYLKHMAFSRQGLKKQLTSEYGEEFTEDEAEYAVSFLELNNLVNWYEQAEKSAESYLKYMAFSRQGLKKQLTSEYGEMFTEDEAEYAVSFLESNNLVDWNEQAVRSAESYLEYFSFSRDELYRQLTSEYGEQFTAEQAEYALNIIGF